MLSILPLTNTLTCASGILSTLTNTARWVLVCGDSTAWLQDEQKNCELKKYDKKRRTYLDTSWINALNMKSTYFAPLVSVRISRFSHESHTNQQHAVCSSTPVTTPAIKWFSGLDSRSLQEFTMTSWPLGGSLISTEQTAYLQQDKCNQDMNEVIKKEGRLAPNLSDCQKCLAVYILHETGREKNKHL